MKKLNISKKLCALVMIAALVIGQIPAAALVHAAETSVSIENSGSRLNARVEGISSPSYQWQIADSADGEYANINGANSSHYDIKADDQGKFIRVRVSGIESTPTDAIGQLIVFDIAKGGIELGATYSGKDSAGNSVTGNHAASNIYVVQQSNNGTLTGNSIVFSGNFTNKPFDLTLDGVNMGQNPVNHNQSPGASGTDTPSGGMISIPAASDAVKNVTIRLKGENVVRHISYYNGGDTQSPATVKSSLKFTDINGDGASDGGSLYVPVKLSANEIDAFIKTKTNYNHWNSGIGGEDSRSLVQNLHIAGGRIQVVTTLGDNCTAIGAGGNGYCQMEISGGEVYAYCNGTGAAIGGGIGWNAAGGPADVLISGGKVYAKNYSEIETTKDGVKAIVGGVAIGAGSSFYAAGSYGNVVITGGTVEAYGTFGNGIGGGNSSTSTGGAANIDITGGAVTATSIGGGNSKKGNGGTANVNVSGIANVTLIKGIGGGLSESGNGGAATITVDSGTMTCGGVIGGGNGGLAGDGGIAAITVNGGVLTSKSIGGGTGGTSGNGGAADIIITGGTIETGSIGGGSTLNTGGKLGYAKANISGGDISGQFLMAAGGTEPCSFIMTGGTLHGVNTADNSKYTYTQIDGAAVYMDDPNGQVDISGGTIEDCQAENGGAVYMTAGTFNLSGTGLIQDCESLRDGGAVYLGGGTMNVSGGVIKSNLAADDGGAVYLGGGQLKVSAGEISDNKAESDGGAAYINGGNVVISGGSITGNTADNNGGGIAVNNGNYKMTGGAVDNNHALTGAGGGLYVSADGQDITVEVLSGSVSNNTANGNGGAFAVIGNPAGTEHVTVTVGVNELHFDSGGNAIVCEHGSETALTCPVLNQNKSGASGGGIYVTGNTNTVLNLYCLTESGSVADGDSEQSNFMKVDGGKVTVTTADSNNQTSYYGNTHISNTIYVTGGQVDIWGKMTNPRIEEVITVDITKEGDYFLDHRAVAEYYKLIYYENFTDPNTGLTTGQYKEIEVLAGGSETISGNIYSHPGYTIVGWNTDPGGNDNSRNPMETGGQGWYEVGKDYVFNGNPIGDLTIYAIWEANGYTVVFDPNVPKNENYTGQMENQIFIYGVEDELNVNDFKRPGYTFKGWNTKADGTGTSYDDGQTVMNLTEIKGEVVTLYAKWEACDHNPETHHYTYSVINNGTTLKRDCSCGGYSETAALKASDAEYEKDKQHPVNVEYSSSNWTPSVVYKKGQEVLTGAPVYAGTYTASISEGGSTASITYTVKKASQPTPPKPEYDAAISDDSSVLRVKPVAESPLKESDPEGYNCIAEYQIVYYVGDERRETEWKAGNVDDVYAAEFELNVALTNYYVYARYSEGDNYKASAATPADSVYFFAGDVQIRVEGGAGVLREVVKASEENGNVNGVSVKVKAETGYYLPDNFAATVVTYQKPEQGSGDLNTHGTQATIKEVAANSEYAIEGIPTSCLVIITITDAKKIPAVNGRVAAGEEFGYIDEANAVTISRDSAYTVSFSISDFDAYAYESASLAFDRELPADTAIIMLDKTKGNYYRFVLRNNERAVQLTEFVRMGSDTETFDLYDGLGEVQFAVDFSECYGGKITGDTLLTHLELKHNANHAKSALDVTSADLRTRLEDEGRFEIKEISVSGTEGVINCVYHSEVKASKWNDREGALVLMPEGNLPADAYIKYYDGQYNVNTYRNPDGSFILPLSDFSGGEIKVTLNSSMLVPTEEYQMNVAWIVADSVAGSAPHIGEKVAESSISFNGGMLREPSIKIVSTDTSDDRIYANTESVNARLLWQDVNDWNDMSVALLRKQNDGQFSGTGWIRNIELSGGATEDVFDVSLGGQTAGSYCLHVTVVEGLVRVTEAKYYFIIQ